MAGGGPAHEAARFKGMGYWVAGITLLCAAPAFLMGCGVDLSTSARPLTPGDVSDLDPRGLDEAAHHALRGSFTHSLLEWSALCAAIFVGVLCAVHHGMRRDASLAIIGMALLCAGAMDAFHTLAADRLIPSVADNRDLIPFTWAICRLFKAVIPLIGVALFVFPKWGVANRRGGTCIFLISAAFVLAAYLVVAACATSRSLPQTMFPDSFIKRPYDVLPLVPYLLCAVWVYPRYLKQHKSLFAMALMISLIPDVATQLYMAFGSDALHDGAFNAAHALKIVSYGVPLVFLCMQFVSTHRAQKALAGELEARSRDLVAARNDAERSSAAKAQFLANMSHEIRTPLNGVLGISDLLGQSDLDEDQRHLVETLQRSGHSLLTVLNDVLDLSKIEAGRFELEEVPFDPWVQIEDSADLFADAALQKGIELAVVIDPRLPDEVVGDPARLKQVAVNLIGNAVKFTETGSVTVAVEARKASEDSLWIDLRVTDTGIGMETEILDRVFRRFTQADESTTRQFGGTGLGLSICHELAEMLGGSISATSTPGEGSEFYFTAAFGGRIAPPADHGRMPRVLVADDRESVVRAIRMYLGNVGLSVDVVSRWSDLQRALSQPEPGGYAALLLRSDLAGLQPEALAGMATESEAPPVILLRPYGLPLGAPGTRTQESVVATPLRRAHLMRAVAKVVSIDSLGRSQESSPDASLPELKGRVLLVEDNAVNQVVGRRHLEGLGVQVDVAEHGAAALEAIRAVDYDVVLMDCHMPVMDGYEATRRLRVTHPDLPIVALTAAALDRDRALCMEAGMNGFLTKPFNQADLARTLQRWLLADASPVV